MDGERCHRPFGSRWRTSSVNTINERWRGAPHARPRRCRCEGATSCRWPPGSPSTGKHRAQETGLTTKLNTCDDSVMFDDVFRSTLPSTKSPQEKATNTFGTRLRLTEGEAPQLCFSQSWFRTSYVTPKPASIERAREVLKRGQ